MRVAELMRSDLQTIGPDATVAEIVQIMSDTHVSGLPVVTSEGRMLGVVSATDVLRAAAEQNDPETRADLFENTTARDLMTPQPLVVEPEADVREAAQQMLYAEVKRLFVEDSGRLVGVISQTDIAYAIGTGKL